MIAYLDGLLNEKAPGHVVIVVGGVGYKVFIPTSTFYKLPAEGECVPLRIHTNVREDTLSLYGFFSKKEQLLFDQLVSVSGVGPSLALKVISGLEPQTVIDSIRLGDRRRLNAIPGVGKKTAERLILELRDKMPQLGPSEEQDSSRLDSVRSVADNLVSALVNLGFQRASSEKEVQVLLDEHPSISFEDALKGVLRKLSS